MSNFANDKKELFLAHWRTLAAGQPEPVLDYKFHPTRKWQIDCAFPDAKIGVEINGAVYTQGRHTRGAGVEGDYEKLNAAQSMGWKVFQFSTGQLERDPFGCVMLVVNALDPMPFTELTTN